jgi:2-oxo-4-hydroxy-4-carboxy-5-ureidoimidazoline decarboxylase
LQIAASNEICRDLQAEDWLEAFRSHPRIGESRTSEDPALESKSAQSVTWSTQEQRNVADADAALKKMLAEANREYERRFNRIFIVCASGKSAAEIMEILHRRLNNDAQTELREAAEQQRQITEIRLKKWLKQ